ncbi:MAG: folate-binding protein YgfZ [Magnetospirillum sp.]|nr:folate-binding protein YgfZ [Magnetospirillum sp.]
MAATVFVRLTGRAVLALGGEDRHSFLQGLVSNDVAAADGTRAVWAAFLTPQGKFQHDLFVADTGDTLLIDAEAERIHELLKKLSLYRMKSKVTLALAAEMGVFAVLGDGALDLPRQTGASRPFAGGVAFVDPRPVAIGARVMAPVAAELAAFAAAGVSEAPFAAWDQARLAFGLPDGSRDLPIDKGILLENGFDELGGVSFTKGCYLGQELTSRTKHRGLVRKRLMPVTIDGPLPASGTPVMLGEAEAGEMRSASGSLGVALIRLEQFRRAEGQAGAFTCGEARLTPRRPDWAVFPETE